MIDIDSLPFTSALEAPNARYHFRHHRTGALDPGVRYVSLLDWRRIERLHHRLEVECTATAATFWGRLRSLRDSAGGLEVWFTEPDGMRTYVYSGTGLRKVLTRELIDRGTADPRLQALVLRGSDALETWALNRRVDTTWTRCAHVYHLLKVAIESRLRKHLVATTHNLYGSYDDRIIVVTNEDREHVVLWRDGSLDWDQSRSPVLRAG